MIRLPCFDPTYYLEFGTGFRLKKKGISTRVLRKSCSFICELDVRLLN